jgi:hypothetical protein
MSLAQNAFRADWYGRAYEYPVGALHTNQFTSKWPKFSFRNGHEGGMARKHKPKDIIGKLREAEIASVFQ